MQGISAEVLNLKLFLEAQVPKDDALLETLVRETFLRTSHPRMVGGPVLGALLRLLITLQGSKRILEVGTFTGYTTIGMARAAGEGCQIDTLEYSAHHASIASKYFEQSGLSPARITLKQGDALDILPTLEGTYDLIFLDANKDEYPQYLRLVHRLLAKGSLLIADNVLWDGKVPDPNAHDKRTDGLREYLRILREDPRYDSSVQPMHDGVSLARRIQ